MLLNWTEVLLGTAAAWTIGLTLPLLIRFVVLRRPAPKKAVPSLLVAFFFTNLLVFNAIGIHGVRSDKPGTAMLFFVGLASYYILEAGRKKETGNSTQAAS